MTEITWHLQTIAIKDIKLNTKNPRNIKKEQLAHLEALISKFGLIDKPIMNLDNMLIGGHQRIKILKKMKIKEVQCWIPERLLTQEEIDHLCIGLNLNQGQWDWDCLANLYEPIDLLDWGFTPEQLLGCGLDEDITEVEEEKAKVKKEKNCPNCGSPL